VSTLPAAPQIELPVGSFSGDRGMLERQHAQLRAEMLERQRRPQDRRGSLYALLICSVVGVAVAAGVWAWMPDGWAPLSVTMTQPAPAQVPEPAPVVATRESTPQQTVADLVRQRYYQKAMREPKSTQETASSPDRSEPASFAATMTRPPPTQVPVPGPVVATREPTPQQTVSDFVTRHLDADELASMLQRADDLIKSGDLSSARLLLRRVAARAAFTLAVTYDPNVLNVLGLQDGAPDIAMARLWYERAAQLGSGDAPRHGEEVELPGQNPNRDMAGAISTVATVQPPAPAGTTEPEEPPGKLEGAVVPSIATAPSTATDVAKRGGVAGDAENEPAPRLPGSGVEVAKVTADTRAAIDRPDVKTTADKLKESKEVKPPGQKQNRDMAGALSVTCQTSRPAGDGFWWAWRLIDGRKCWYKGAPGMDKSLLHWPPFEHVWERQ
jgi:hypothetical protein